MVDISLDDEIGSRGKVESMAMPAVIVSDKLQQLLDLDALCCCRIVQRLVAAHEPAIAIELEHVDTLLRINIFALFLAHSVAALRPRAGRFGPAQDLDDIFSEASEMA